MSDVLDMHNSQGLLRVFIVVSVRLYRDGLAASLRQFPQIAVVGMSGACQAAYELAAELRPDVIIVDMATRESLSLIRRLRTAISSKILAFAIDEMSAHVLECAEAGASGYVVAEATTDELVGSIERIARQELVCSPRVAAQIFSHLAARPSLMRDHACETQLTLRERQVLDLICQGQSNKEIAQKLHISGPTVKNHVHHLLAKLNVTTRARAAAQWQSSAASRINPIQRAG